MGSRIIYVMNETPSIVLCQAVERPDHPSIGKDIGEVIGLGRMNIPLEGELKKDGGDVIINFTNPKTSVESLEFAKEKGLAIVIGTTGLSPEQIERVKDLSKSVRCVFSPNMSVGVNVMFRIVQEVAQVLGPEYDIEIFEAHQVAPKALAHVLVHENNLAVFLVTLGIIFFLKSIKSKNIYQHQNVLCKTMTICRNGLLLLLLALFLFPFFPIF
jgi:hypothetical protein